MPGSMDFEIRYKASPQAAGLEAQKPFRILVLGDFSGRTHWTSPPTPLRLPDRPLLPVDVDTLGLRLSQIAPQLQLQESGARIAFGDLEDFHPDHLYRSLEPFKHLEATRKRLLDPATFGDALRELSEITGAVGGAAPATPPAPPAHSDQREDDSATLQRLLGGPRAEAPPKPSGPAAPPKPPGFSRLLADAVRGDIVASPDSRRDEAVNRLDTAIANRMRGFLHHPSFQELESTWRALHHLVSNISTDGEVRIEILDVTSAELSSDLLRADSPQESTLHHRLVESEARTFGVNPWSLIVAGFTFGAGEEDLRLLAALGALASRAGGPLLAAASPEILGAASALEIPDPSHRIADPDRDRRWLELRQAAAARWVGLALPRILVRLPYGRWTDPIESFAFEEVNGTRPEHESFLWGNPAFACAFLLAAAYQEGGLSRLPRGTFDLGDLPSHVFQDEHGQSRQTPCAETLLGDAAAGSILDQGIMPVLSHRDRNVVRFPRIQSVAIPAAPLSGPWTL